MNNNLRQMEITFTKEDIELVEKFIEIRNRGYYASGQEVTNLYNRIMNKKVTPTNCGACIRRYIGEMENELNRFKRLSEATKPAEPTPVPQDKTKPVKTKKKK